MIDLNKKYKLRSMPGYNVVPPIIIGNTETSAYPVTAEVTDGAATWWTNWTIEGNHIRAIPDGNMDLVEDTPDWRDWPIDAPVLYRSKGQKEYTKAHYAGELDGRPTVWILGVTSWTAEYLTGAHETRQFAFEIELADEE